MYPVSEAFAKAIEDNTRKYYWTGRIVTVEGASYDFTNGDILKGSGYITRSCCGSGEIELGSVYAAEMGITLLKDIDRYTLENARIDLTFHLVLPDGTEESVPMGVFEVTEANRGGKRLELKAYDYMLRFDKALDIEASSGTPYNFLRAACNACEVELAQTRAEIDALPNGTETLGVYAENDIETFRDLLHYVAQALACCCQINREGKLELRPYGDTPAAEIQMKHRFTSSYSDFVTRYTAVSSTNKITNEAEYYALETDDALTMNLGVNPLLQFGMKATRERILTNILKALAAVNYVPFDSDTIGNPALDPGDILVLSGGQADSGKISCITSVTCRINGKMSLKCVGKNPRLSGAKSKNDKDIAGLLSQVEANKTIVYDFVNASPISIGSSPVEAMLITFVSREETSAMFLAEVLIDIKAEDNSRPVLTVIYRMNGDEIADFRPAQACHEGKQILTLFFPIGSVLANSENTFSMYLEMEGGTGSIGEAQLRATLSGQGLVAGIGDWNGRISVTETLGRFSIDSDFPHAGLTDEAYVSFPAAPPESLTQTIGRISIIGGFGYEAVNERLTVAEIVKTFTMDKTYPGEYDPVIVEVTEDGTFRMRRDYEFTSVPGEVNSGLLERLSVDTAPFERVESHEVSLC